MHGCALSCVHRAIAHALHATLTDREYYFLYYPKNNFKYYD